MKYVLWVDASSDLLKVRVALWGLTAIVTSKEFFEYIDDPNCKRVGPFFWLSTYTLMIEYGIWFKFSRGMFLDVPYPWYVYYIFVGYSSMVILGAVYAQYNGMQTPLSSRKVYKLEDPEITIENT